MKIWKLGLVLGAFLLFGSLGCGSCGADEEIRGELKSYYCSPLAEAFCEDRQSCQCPQWRAEEGCFGELESRCVDGLEEVVRDLRRGKLELNEAAGEACREYLESLSGECKEPETAVLSSSCGLLVSAPVEIGEACPRAGVGCADGRGACFTEVCESIGGEEGADCNGVCQLGWVCVSGECRRIQDAGGECEGDQQCRGALRCMEGICGEAFEGGEECERDEQCPVASACQEGICQDLMGTSCQEEGECGYLASCQVFREWRCAYGGFAGASCGDNWDCDSDLICQGGSCADGPGEGEECADGVRCGPGLACGMVSGLCEPTPQEGESCAIGLFGPRVCADGLYCLASGVCGSELPRRGEACTADLMCAEGLGCEFRTDGRNICGDQGGVGAECANDSVCKPGTFCNFGTLRCEAAYDLGARCSAGNECGPDRVCAPDGQGRFRCRELPGEGELCFDECAPELKCLQFSDPEGRCLPDLCGHD